MDYDQLNESRQALVDEFRGITDVADDDNPKVIRLLEVHDWNLNNAILSYFDNGFIQESNDIMNDNGNIGANDTDTVAASTSGVATGSDFSEIGGDVGEESLSHLHSRHYSTLANSFELSDLIPKLPFAPRISSNWQLDIGINASLNHHNQTLNNSRRYQQYQSTTLKTLNSIWFILLFIPNKVFTMLYHVFKYFFLVNKDNYFPSSVNYDAIDLDYKLPVPEGESNESTNETNNESSNDSSEKQVSIDSEYNIHNHDFNQVYETCKNNYQWLLVILVNDSPECKNFYQKLLTNNSFQQLFSKSRGQYDTTKIFITDVIKNPEGFEIGKTYKAKRLPYVMLINNVTNNPNIMASMSITYKSNISSAFLTSSNLHATVNKIVSNLKKIINHYNPQVISALADKREIEISRQLKEFQDSAYEKSLQMDKQKKLLKQQELQKQKLLTTRKQYLISLIRSQWFENLSKTTTQDSVKPLRIQVKLPHGQSLRLTVNNHEITMFQLYMYVELKLFVQSMIDDETDPITSEQDITEINDTEDGPEAEVDQKFIDEYRTNFPFKFELVQPYPKKVFDNLDNLMVQELKSGDSLLVEYTLEEDEDEDEDEDEEK